MVSQELLRELGLLETLLIPDEYVEMRWNSFNKKFYEPLGYEYTGRYTTFKLHIKDLRKGSKLWVILQCPYKDCGVLFGIIYYDLFKRTYPYCPHHALRAPGFKDLTGQRFGKLVALEYLGQSLSGSEWRCKCDCGNEHISNTHSLTRYLVRSCGCIHGDYTPHDFDPISKESEEYKLRTRLIPGYRTWWRGIVKRDNKTCRLCESVDKVSVHHIYSFRHFEDLRMEDSNALCLCKVCHMGFHNIYSNQINDLSQFIEYCLERFDIDIENWEQIKELKEKIVYFGINPGSNEGTRRRTSKG